MIRTGVFSLALAVGIAAQEPAPSFTFRDGFSGYAEGSDASPAWVTGSLGWAVRRGSFACSEPERDFAAPARAPHGRRVAVEAVLTLREASAKGWKIAGLAVRRDDRNYWHLAMIEAPDDQGKRRSVELSEMLEGTWLAQWQEGTKLAPLPGEGGEFAWEYGRPYRLRIEMAPSGITGTVREMDGTLRAKRGFAFAGKAVTAGQPGLTAGGFRAEYREFSAEVGLEAPPGKPTYPPFTGRGHPRIRRKASGFFRVEKTGGTWWMLDPAGNAFFAVGTDHANYRVHWCEKLGYAPYHKNCEKRYGGEEKWAESTLARLKEWGFNALGTNSSASLRRRGLPHTEFLGMGTGFAAIDPITPKTTWTGFPNVFSPDFERFCDKRARQICAPNKGDPWLLGYFLDNELEWHPWTGGGPFADTFRKPARHSAKTALVEFFRKRHGTIDAFNRAWGLKAASFDELARRTDPPAPPPGAAEDDLREFIRLVAERYFSVAAAAVRRHDPNHLVLGCRFAGTAPEIADVVGKHCDVVSVNFYRTLDLETGAMTDGFEDDLAGWHAKTGRPLMITEWSFPALDAGLPCRHGAGQRVPTQADRAFAFTAFQKLLFSAPFVVGSNFFMWADEPELGISSTFPEDSNYGLVDVHDEPYTLLTRAAARLHPLVYEIHEGRVSDVKVTAAGEGRFAAANAGKAGAKGKAVLWTDGAASEREIDLPPGAFVTLEPPPAERPSPGPRFHACRIELREPLLEKSTTDLLATQAAYVPGASWREGERPGARRLPILVANPTGRPLEDVVAVAGPTDLAGVMPGPHEGMTVRDAETGKPAEFQVDGLSTGTEVAVLVRRLDPYSAKAFFVYPDGGPWPWPRPAVRFKEGEATYEVDTGTLRLLKSDPRSGDAFDRIEHQGLELGRFAPLVWQKLGQNAWVRAERVERAEHSAGPLRLVLDVAASKETPGGPMRFRARHRFVFYPGREWFESRLVWLENADAAPWRAAAYYHYALSNIGGSAADDEPRRSHWFDPASGAGYGVIPGSLDLAVHFWKDDGGGQHPDAARKLDRLLKPGERYAEVESPAYVAGTKREWGEVERELAARRKVILRVFAPEAK